MAPLEIDWSLRDLDWLHFLTIPLVTGTVGWLINWTGLIMLFGPIRFHGIRVPGKRELAAMHSVRMPKVVRRSIHLTPFGQEFCSTVLAPEGRTGRAAAARGAGG